MRPMPVVLLTLLLAVPALHAQESQKAFTATAAGESQACDAAKKQAREWVKRGKSEGRARSLLDDGQCHCTPAGGARACTLDVRVSDEQHEEEEER